MAIYSALHIDTTGANGTQLRPKQEENSTLSYIGEITGRHYYIGLAGIEQHTEIDLRQEQSSDAIDALIKGSQLAKAGKQSLRRDIENNIGDVHDLLADQAKTIEFLFVMVARMAEEFLGGAAITPATRTEYLARVQSITGALDAGAVTLRGDFTQPDKMLTEVLGKTDAINKMVKAQYVDKINELIAL